MLIIYNNIQILSNKLYSTVPISQIIRHKIYHDIFCISHVIIPVMYPVYATSFDIPPKANHIKIVKINKDYPVLKMYKIRVC